MIKVSSEVPSVLAKIVEDKAQQIAALQQQYPAHSLQPKQSDRSLFEALKNGPAGFILECKKASPSKGLIRENFEPANIAATYQGYAAAVSVLTDEKYFQGSFEFLPQVKQHIHQPMLCKDFFVDEYQIDLAAHFGADAILLMLSVLDDQRYQALASHAQTYQLDVLTEVSNEHELERAVALNAQIIGINNRNLRDLTTDLSCTEQLAPRIPNDRVIISESGIYTNQQVRRLAPLVDGFLVGSSLMAQKDLDLACRQLIYGETKICGLSKAQDAQAVASAGAVYGGLIFHPSSPRAVTLETALPITQAAALKFVGVFVNAEIEQVIQSANALSLFAVQLHGDEDQAYVDELKKALVNTEIWQAISPSQTPLMGVDQVLLDHKTAAQPGGSGQTLDWMSPQVQAYKPGFLAGGLTPSNVKQAINAGFIKLDVNSGVEASKGVKSADLITQVMQQIRDY
ncbi:bifunctional indole-3-glycerol-phosphate synthase TrpC/phosphoribosylanthranilate isomerase TrpF [Paraferrimonas haliotis]|uniref:Multifunctional fusion protein n=1 Tax=Paraferrimonas haliotis TaxID=2013866 RepID=A0AA37TMC3_9GAMM|nr:bifunctional indole-3-glycerol-phosphate synthase TrpC/phosphoribosylanthranilate isomerase TrpF [Paraferrimonas haliotis]GLS84142.1 bifunctional indole-3-glycerol phosphate synthase/phosphoribosylanthranilate isomerase [Paraferrimonas haliotis]